MLELLKELFFPQKALEKPIEFAYYDTVEDRIILHIIPGVTGRQAYYEYMEGGVVDDARANIRYRFLGIV